MIQDIFPHKFSNEFVASAQIEDRDYVFHFSNNCLLLKIVDNSFELPRKSDLLDLSQSARPTFLFTLNDTSCFLVWQPTEIIKEGFEYKDMAFLRTINQPEITWVGLVGHQIVSWYQQNKFCGKCGSKTQEKADERAIECPNCHSLVFPKISPAIIVAIVCNDKILLANNANFRPNWYSLIAGYVDIGESIEDTVAREVKEEVGLDVKNIRYYKSQPWPISSSMMIGFVAEADDAQTICVDKKEITEAAWFTRGNLPNRPTNISIAGELIDLFERNEL